MAAALHRIRELPPPQGSGRRLAADVRAVMDLNRRLVIQRNDMAAELGPVWKLRAHPMYGRLRKFRHTRVGRVVTWPARKLVKLVMRRSG